jgi:aldose sugar dehydrogenase
MSRSVCGFLAVGAALALSYCGGSSPAGPSGPTAVAGGTPSVVVKIMGQDGNMSFSPNPVVLKAGQAVAWTNADVIPHQPVQNTAAASGNAGADGYGGGTPGNGSSGFNVGMLAPGATSNALSFTSAGTLNYHCSIHPSMTGTITITQ